jgi:hypothetical protein
MRKGEDCHLEILPSTEAFFNGMTMKAAVALPQFKST